MSYRLLRITGFYKEYIQAYYHRYPEINHLNYNEQYNHIVNDSIEMVSSYSKFLRKIGVDAVDIITNAQHLQNAWIKEHNISPDISFKELIVEQIKHLKPDIVWVDDTRLLNKKWVQYIRTEIPSLKLIVGHICAPHNSDIIESFPAFDIMFTCSPCDVRDISKYGVPTQLVYHSFDHSILERVKIDNNFGENNFVFTGSLLTGYGMHKTRIEYIEKILENNFDIKIFGNIEQKSKIRLKQSMYYTINFLKRINCEFLTNKISILRKHKNYGDEKIKYYSGKLIKSIEPPVFGIDMFKMLSKSKLCFNIHGDIAKNRCAGNVRLFEATGVGTCLLTDWKENITDLFEPEKEIVTYKSEEDCIEKLKWLFENPGEMKKIAEAGQARTLKDHTIENRAKIIDATLRNKLNK